MIKYKLKYFIPKSFIRVFVIVGLLAAVVFLLYFSTRPTRTYRDEFKGLRSPISGPLDANQLEITKNISNGAVVMDKDQLYFNVFFNDIFTNAIFKIKFSNENNQQLDLKIPIDKDIGDAVRYHLEQKKIDGLKNNSGWGYLQDKSTILLQRQESKIHFNSIDQFLHDLPITKNGIGVVGVFGDYILGKDINISKTQIITFDYENNLRRVDYIIGRYEPWKQDGEWKTNTYEVVIPEMFRKKNVEFPFVLEASNLKKEQNKIKIDSIEVILKRPDLSLIDKTQVFFQRVFSFKESTVEIK